MAAGSMDKVINCFFFFQLSHAWVMTIEMLMNCHLPLGFPLGCINVTQSQLKHPRYLLYIGDQSVVVEDRLTIFLS